LKPILEVKNLWKQYKIGGQQASYLSLRERLLQPFQRQEIDTFWALQDINFDVHQGECIGIIGRNGAGKSTLLKILSQITPPTKGYIKARGRIASLLEVGTGFHPELTGRENVYLNGSILGLKRSEINAKFDEIIDFSGIEKFLDTPLKHYSSGMRLRLAFSVAAHLEPEILLIDEVLAVGDAEFQKKCLGKMDEVSKSGRTVIFVSHNLGAVRQLCSRGILLKNGKIEIVETIDTILEKYKEHNVTNQKDYKKDSIIRSLKIEQVGNRIKLHAAYHSKKSLFVASLGFTIYNNLGYPVTGFNPTLDYRLDNTRSYASQGKIVMEMTQPILLDGIYTVTVWFGDGYKDYFEDPHCLKLEVKNMTLHRQFPNSIVGFVIPECEYHFI
jgi:lipopolysaccharide transport system ATP-binding protein